jgi:hypothetical protein
VDPLIRLVEQSHLQVRRTLPKLGIQSARFYRWYDCLQTGGPEALEGKSTRPNRVWKRIPDERKFICPQCTTAISIMASKARMANRLEF